MELYSEIAAWIKKQVEEAHKSGVIFGLSGGVDSATVAALSKLALEDKVLGLILPCETGPEDMTLASKVAKKFNIKTKEIALDNMFSELVKKYPEASPLAKANLKPRLRMATLYYFANSLDYLVVGTGNKSELVVGYFTKYGDGGADILPLGGLLKAEVRKLAANVGVPDEVIKRVPSAGLWEGQTDEGELGITYDELDKVIDALEKNRTENISRKSLQKVKKMMRDSEHKRRRIPVFNILRYENGGAK